MSTGTWEAHLNGTIEVHGMKLGSGSRFKEVGDIVKFHCSGVMSAVATVMMDHVMINK